MTDYPTLLPSNASELEIALDIAGASSSDLDVWVTSVWSADECPPSYLAWLAWSLSVDTWDTTAPDAVKREIIRQSAAVHRHKGTAGSVKRALAATGAPSEIIEWWQDAATPHTFKVQVDVAELYARGNALSPTLIDRIKGVIDPVKPVRSHYTVQAVLSADASTYCGIASLSSGRVANEAGIPPAPIIEGTAYAGLAAFASAHFQTPTMEAPV